jgi:hypothetical protein
LHHSPTFLGSGAAGKDLDKLQPLCEHLQHLLLYGLSGMHLLRAFFSSQIQPLRRWRTKMWTYPGPSCPNHPSSQELSAVEVEEWIHKVLDLRVVLTPGSGPVPL